MGLSSRRHKVRVGTRSISDVIFVMFVIILGELNKVENLAPRLNENRTRV